MNKKYNILFLASWYPNTTSPQAGNFIQKHAQSVAACCNVSVLHVVSRVQNEDFIVENSKNNGIFEVIVYYKKISTNIPVVSNYRKFKSQLTAYKKGFQVILEEFKKIDLVHLNVLFPAGIFALHLKQKLNIPFIATEHWTAFLKSDPTKINTIEKYYIKKIAKQAEVICPVSENLKKEMVNFGIQTPFQVIPNVVDTKLFHPQINSENNNKRGILHVSSLKDEHKNITGILNVIKKLSEKRNDFILTIAGNGDANKFRLKAKEMSIPSDVILFEGEKSTQEVAQLLNINDMFLLFSHYENLPCVISESLVMGLPVITSDVGGINEMINERNGILVPPGNEEELYQQLNNILDNIHKYNRLEISNAAKEIYAYEAVGKQFYSIYQKILN